MLDLPQSHPSDSKPRDVSLLVAWPAAAGTEQRLAQRQCSLCAGQALLSAVHTTRMGLTLSFH